MLKFVKRHRFLLILLLQICIATVSYTSAFLIRYNSSFRDLFQHPFFLQTLILNVGTYFFFSIKFNLFHGVWRYVNYDDLRDIIKSSLLSFVVSISLIILTGKFNNFPRSIYLINLALYLFLQSGLRFLIPLFRENLVPMFKNSKNILIIGAGKTGQKIVTTIRSTPPYTNTIVGFIDSDDSLLGRRYKGIKILGGMGMLNSTIKKYRIHEIIIAIPKATNKTVNEIMTVSKIPSWNISFKIVPSLLEIMTSKMSADKIRDLTIDDLVNRSNITLDNENLRKEIANKSVLITGAAGSIGTELSFQIAAFNPSRIILLDLTEEHLVNLDYDLKRRFENVAVHSIIGSVLDKAVLDMLFREFGIDYVVHTALYKHNTLSDWSPTTYIKNNVLGTATLADSAEKHGVNKFVLLSSTAASAPFGANNLSYRLAERVVLERNPSATKFNVVRFGNVLGSSGSVIPLFQQQIRDGGPITVTSTETKRFFMSIPEAVQLVLQASTLEESNVIFMLEMGEPIKIVDLAKNLIELSGLKVDEDIEIKVIGMRPGEKISEELLTSDENLIKTKFEKIRMQKNINYDPDRINGFVHDLKSHVEIGNIKEIYKSIKELIPEMTGPSFDELRKNMFG